MPKHLTKQQYEEEWYWYLTGENKEGFSTQYQSRIKLFRRFAGLFPGAPRCFECDRPLFGWAGRLSMTHPSSFSPRLCSTCEESIREAQAGAEVEMSLLFADVRGSTTLAEQSTPGEFKQLIQRFYQTATQVLIGHNAMVNRLMGDQVIGLFVPRFTKSAHAQAAVDTALDLLRATGHGGQAAPWIPVGIGINTGLAWVGAVGTNTSVNEIAVLGNAANLAARLSSQAADGEILISQATSTLAGLDDRGLESRSLELKGISQPVSVRVMRLEFAPVTAA